MFYICRYCVFTLWGIRVSPLCCNYLTYLTVAVAYHLQATKSTGVLKCFDVGSMLAYVITNHIHTWERMQEANQGSHGDLQNQFVELDGITQLLMKEWTQKAADRVSLEKSIIVNMIKLVSLKCSFFGK